MKQHPDKKVLVVPRKLCSPGKENEVAVTDHTVEKRCKILPVDPSRLKILVENPVQYYKVLYTKFAANKKRKNKSYADGILSVNDANCTLYTDEGKIASKAKAKGCEHLADGAEIVIGNWELEVDTVIDEAAFKAGRCFMQPAVPLADSAINNSARLPHKPATGFKLPTRCQQPQQAKSKPKWLHNPEAECALILNAGQGDAIPVVVDPYLCRHLRQHQREGVAFMYRSIMGLQTASQTGCVLADEMGLGKTLQVIALLWTALKQGPQGGPIAKRAIVVTPSSLMNNWKDEFRKWLGEERLQALVLQSGPDAAQQVQSFKHGCLFKVLIGSYESVRKHASSLAGACDLLVCDEGHRLKAATGSKTMDSLLGLGCKRRIILTGTPLQNNLDEFWALISFVCPNALGSQISYKTVFSGPISRSKDRDASQEDIELGNERSRELTCRVDSMVLRRTSDAIAKFLPPLTTYVVFCRPSKLQVKLYTSIIESRMVSQLLSSTGSLDVLPAITMLRKLCNHPLLVTEDLDKCCNAGIDPHMLDDDRAAAADPDLSGKLACLVELLQASITEIGDRVVVVCSSVKALDVIQSMCSSHNWSTARIDGATSSEHRQDIVTGFNLYGGAKICLLSTRAGGAGLNLIGANRLVLFDSDWNPAVDLQAMARVWRDGQPKPCVVYRLLTTGTIDEKVYQRQLMKGELSSVLSAAKDASKGGFSREELRELFRLDTETACNTADLLPNFPNIISTLEDGPLLKAVESDLVSYIHSAPGRADDISVPLKRRP